MQTRFLNRQRGPVTDFWCIPIDECADNIAQALVLLPGTLGRQWTSCHLALLSSWWRRVFLFPPYSLPASAANTKTSVRAAPQNSLTAMVAYMRPLFNNLRHCLITFWIFVRCQRLIARNVANGFLLNRGVSHCYEACCINEVSRGSLSSYKNI